jgi:hypothetical protein
MGVSVITSGSSTSTFDLRDKRYQHGETFFFSSSIFFLRDYVHKLVAVP